MENFSAKDDTSSEEIYKIILKYLECPVCKMCMSKPIKMCTLGHNLCMLCRDRHPNCPICLQSFTTTQNLILETLAEKIPTPCINQRNGCPKKIIPSKRSFHENVCEFQQIKCVVPTCEWSGLVTDVRTHFMEQEHCLFEQGLTILALSEMYISYMMKSYGERFWFRQCKMDNRVFWTVQYIGAASKASDFIYAIEFVNVNGTKIIQFQDKCQSVFIKDTELFNEKYSTVIDEVWLRGFSKSRDRLHCSVIISSIYHMG